MTIPPLQTPARIIYEKVRHLTVREFGMIAGQSALSKFISATGYI
jgi:hypothetical protein